MARKEGLIGRKVGMTQVFADDGSHVPVTVIQAGPCTVVGIRSRDRDGYDALQLGFEPRRKGVNKPTAGHFKKANVAPMRVLREFRLEKSEMLQGYQVGQAVTAALFAPGELVDVVGVTRPTVRCSIARRARSAPPPIRPACGRATSCRAGWAGTAGRCSTSRWCGCSPSRTSCSCAAPSRAPTARSSSFARR